MIHPIEVHDEQGLRAWAFEADTDPDMVLWAVMMTYAKGLGSLCNWDCPARTGGYCLECHATAYVAKEELGRRGYK
jgi:hypothetical protein